MGGFSSLQFRHPFRKYQRQILDQVETSKAIDRKHHIVAPPGSGKTIVGLELIRRFDEPAVVFAPTATIQQQWCEEVGLFTEGPTSGLVSREPGKFAPINIYTYQLISAPGESRDLLRETARKMWLEELLKREGVSERDARGRLETMRRNKPDAYGKELGRRAGRAKRDLLRRGDTEVACFLHPNARALIDGLVDRGVKTVVLDECHHLLDYWAVVLRYLIGRIRDPQVVGLTATLPSPEDGNEYDNYTSLLGDVDFEVPTPAVVKEGDLAPYRDLVYFTKPTQREMDYLNNVQRAFEAEISRFTRSEALQDWAARSVLGEEKDGKRLEEDLNARPVFSVATLRYLRHAGRAIPGDLLALPLEANEPPTLEDWAALLERYALDHLQTSPREEDHRELATLRRTLRPFGLSLTERGVRSSRSPGDLVLALSDSKGEAACSILAAELEALGERLRAVVVTDFESMSSGARPEEALDRDAGGARRVLERIVHHRGSSRLDPVLVTGRLVLAADSIGPALVQHFNTRLEEEDLRARCRCEQSGVLGVVQIVGEGVDWSPRTYVSLVTDAFEVGLTRCVVGTRGLLGEGWDSPSINVLVDLTSVTTPTSVQQLRGRSIRKDPAWPRKVAHNWDVICVAGGFERGDVDLRRFVRRHGRYWGVTPSSSLTGDRGRVVKGISHVDPDLAFGLSVHGFRHMLFDRSTRRSLSWVGRREESYDLWGVGEGYENSSRWSTNLDVRDLKIRTAYTLQESLAAVVRKLRVSFVLILLSFLFGLLLLLGLFANVPGIVGIPLVLVVAAAFFFNLRSAYRLGKAMLVEYRPDAILGDTGHALLFALQDAGLIGKDVLPGSVRVAKKSDGYEVSLEDASPEDAAVFIRSYRQIFAPVRDQRYLILRNENRLPNCALRYIWILFRPFFRRFEDYPPAYHPVPDVLATRKENAEAFSRYWQRYVGGGTFVYTRTAEGRRMLLGARAQRRPQTRDLAFEVWK
jgi:superfamily II DNA or RNA helicase